MMKKTMLLASVAMIGVGFLAAEAKAQGVPQIVELAKVDVHELSAGYRSSKVVGSSVVNDANETIGKIDDLLVSSRRTLDRRLPGHGRSLGCCPLRRAEIRRKKGDPPGRHQERAQNAAGVQVRNAVISALD